MTLMQALLFRADVTKLLTGCGPIYEHVYFLLVTNNIVLDQWKTLEFN